MPFGIIDVHTDRPLPGTELLIRKEQAGIVIDGDTSELKRVMYKGNETILVPQPSDTDPNDPLLWPRWKKETAFVVLFLNNIIFAALPGPIIAPSTFALAGILDVPITKIAELSGYQLLIVGAIGPLVSVLAQKYGKRPQFLFAAVMGTLGTIICIAGSQQMSYSTLLGGRMVQGLGTTAWESLSLAAMGDMFYLHERGLRTSITVATLTCTPSLVSIIGGVLTQNRGWKTIFIASLPFNLLGLVGAIFFLPESQFRRPGGSGSAKAPAAAESSWSEKQDTGAAVVEAESSDAAPTTPVKPRMTYWQSLAPWSGTYSEKAVGHLLSEIFVHLINPAVIWIQLVSAVLISLYVVTAFITSQIWTPAPYNLNIAQNGYFYTGGFVGGVLATVAGPVCDWTARTLSRLNGGVFEAEFRIPVNIFGVVFCSLGWFLFMWDVNNPRPDGYYLGAFCYGAASFGISIPSTAAGLYILDSFPRHSTEVFILQMMIKNFLFYAFSTMMNTWAGTAGPGVIFRTWGIVSIALLATCIPMYVFGKVNRKFMSDLYAKHKIFRAIG